MTFRMTGLVFIIFFASGCAAMEGPRWAMLGDTNEEAYYIDREDVRRQASGIYSYPVKIIPYEEGHRHRLAEDRDSNRVLFMEMNCHQQKWAELGRGVVDKDNKVMFRRMTPSPILHTIKPGTIHMVAYGYLCDDDSIVTQHNH